MRLPLASSRPSESALAGRAHGDELFSGTRMQGDGAVEIRLGRPHGHGDGNGLDDLAGIMAEDVDAQSFM